jgi:hypothetical protein
MVVPLAAAVSELGSELASELASELTSEPWSKWDYRGHRTYRAHMVVVSEAVVPALASEPSLEPSLELASKWDYRGHRRTYRAHMVVVSELAARQVHRCHCHSAQIVVRFLEIGKSVV